MPFFRGIQAGISYFNRHSDISTIRDDNFKHLHLKVRNSIGMSRITPSIQHFNGCARSSNRTRKKK